VKKKIFCFDLDNTICITKGKQYFRSVPIKEAIARNKKMAVFSTRKTQLSDPGSPFGWPKAINKNGFFYSNTISEKEVFKVLKNTFSCSNGTWRKKTTKIFEGIINYNFNNKKFFKIINKHI